MNSILDVNIWLKKSLNWNVIMGNKNAVHKLNTIMITSHSKFKLTYNKLDLPTFVVIGPNIAFVQFKWGHPNLFRIIMET